MNKLIKKIVTKNLEAQFNKKEVLVPCIIGSRGTGKTTGIKKIAEKMGAAYLNISIPSKDLVYFTG